MDGKMLMENEAITEGERVDQKVVSYSRHSTLFLTDLRETATVTNIARVHYCIMCLLKTKLLLF